MNTTSLFLSSLVGLFVVGCGASTPEADDPAAIDSALDRSQVHRPASRCLADEQVVFNCTREGTSLGKTISLEGYLMSACSSRDGVKVRFGQAENVHEFPDEAGDYASPLGTGNTRAEDGWQGEFLHLAAPSPSSDEAVLFDMGRTVPDAFGQEVGERWLGFALAEHGFAHDVAMFKCHAGDETTRFSASGAPAASEPFDMSNLAVP